MATKKDAAAAKAAHNKYSFLIEQSRKAEKDLHARADVAEKRQQTTLTRGYRLAAQRAEGTTASLIKLRNG